MIARSKCPALTGPWLVLAAKPCRRSGSMMSSRQCFDFSFPNLSPAPAAKMAAKEPKERKSEPNSHLLSVLLISWLCGTSIREQDPTSILARLTPCHFKVCPRIQQSRRGVDPLNCPVHKANVALTYRTHCFPPIFPRSSNPLTVLTPSSKKSIQHLLTSSRVSSAGLTRRRV